MAGIVKSLRAALRSPSGIRSLKLTGVSGDADVAGISRLPDLVHLEISVTGQEIPREVFRIPGLTHLTVGGRSITGLPPEIGSCSRLKKLNVRGHRITAVPREIGKLSRLEALYIDGNALTSLPAEISELASRSSGST
ncbi:leucine-rich repeat domain-containing protein [Sorangium sp. KYC3313]|uniref:leucine-rich repeat domain-containing protein n=1 Tax=Sorangium sp. KYC3313 TaxID=3449740 RepID=UPI003F8B1AA3